MFDRQAYLLEALRTLATFFGDANTGSQLKDDTYTVVKNFAHSYSVYKRLFGDHLKQVDSEPLDELFELVKEIESPVFIPRPIMWLREDVKDSAFWKRVRELASLGSILIESLPQLPKEKPVSHLPLRVVYYTEKRIDNYPPPEELVEIQSGICANDVNWHALRKDLLLVLEKHGLTGPDDPTDKCDFYLLDDQRNEERYHYVEVHEPLVLTLNWLNDTTDVLRNYSGWGWGVMNFRESYMLIFTDRLLVTGLPFRHCKNTVSVLEAASKLI